MENRQDYGETLENSRHNFGGRAKCALRLWMSVWSDRVRLNDVRGTKTLSGAHLSARKSLRSEVTV